MKISTLAALLGLALLAVMVIPTSSAPAPAGTNCIMESMGIDSDKLGSLLNVILNIAIQLLYTGDDDPCKIDKLTDDMEEAIGNVMCFMEGQSEDGQGLLEILLGPLLEALGDLLQQLLGGVGLGSLGELLSNVINLVLCLLNSLGLAVDLKLMLKLGNLLNLDLSAFLNFG